MATAADFRPYLDEIRDCHCTEFCRPRMYLLSLDSGAYAKMGEGREALELLADALLGALTAGSHRHMTREEMIACLRGTYVGIGYTRLKVEM